jgi:RNA polymerase sigma factor (sigma-70 family)
VATHISPPSKRQDYQNLLYPHWAWIHSCCRALGVQNHDLDDVAGEVLLKAYRSLPNFKGQSTFKTWLWHIIHNETMNFYRRKYRQKQREHGLTQHAKMNPMPDPADQMEHADTVAGLKQAINQLPSHWSTAIRLFYWNQQSTRAIAKAMNVNPGVVRIYLYRARNRLRELVPIT